MASSDDSVQVLNSFRLGWYVAEVRGRNRPDGPEHVDPQLPSGDCHPLPLRIERKATERRIEAQGVLAEVARQLGVDEDGTCGKHIDQEAHRLATASDPAGQWTAFANTLWRFDAHIQDKLTACSEMQACAYQLGRGLAETFWALNPTEAQGRQGWRFLLGEPRCFELSRLVGRLSGYLSPYTGPAIVGSIEIWQKFAEREQWDPALAREAQAALREQIRRWYELIVLGQDPTTLIKPFDVIGNFHTLMQAIRQFWPQVAATVLGLGCIVTLLVMLSVGAGSDLVKTLGAVLGVLGVSLGAITGALKNSAQSLLARLRQDTYTELVAEGITSRPPDMTNPELREAMARRTLTPVTGT
jgi:hypothetical protein